MKPIDFAMFAWEAQQVIWLRSLKLAAGGTRANAEAIAMVAEKIDAAQQAAVALALGKPAEGIARSYRAKVRRNLRRLKGKP